MFGCHASFPEHSQNISRFMSCWVDYSPSDFVRYTKLVKNLKKLQASTMSLWDWNIYQVASPSYQSDAFFDEYTIVYGEDPSTPTTPSTPIDLYAPVHLRTTGRRSRGIIASQIRQRPGWFAPLCPPYDFHPSKNGWTSAMFSLRLAHVAQKCR